MTIYQLSGEGYVIRDGGTKISIIDTPLHPNRNTDFLIYQAWLREGGVPRPATPDFATAFAALDTAITAYFDKRAAERRYESRISCAMRAGYEGPFQAEGIAFAKWMDACNEVCYRLLAEVKAGTRGIPSFDEVISTFPQLVWPAVAVP